MRTTIVVVIISMWAVLFSIVGYKTGKIVADKYYNQYHTINMNSGAVPCLDTSSISLPDGEVMCTQNGHVWIETGNICHAH